MSDHTPDHDGSAEHGAHHYNYVKIWAALVVLLIISVLGPMAGIRWLTLLTAFGIAGVKAYLVVGYFMHLKTEKRYIGYLLGTAVAFMVLMFFGVAPDVMKHEGQRWENTAAKAEIQRASAAIEAAGGHVDGAPREAKPAPKPAEAR